MDKYNLIHYQKDVLDTKLLLDDAVTFSVLISILQNECTDIYTNHESLIICHSLSPFPVWVWCKDIDNIEDIMQIAACLKEAFPLEKDYTYNLSYEIWNRLKQVDDYFEQSKIKMNLLSYQLNTMKEINVPCDGTITPARTEDLEYLTILWHDLCLEMEGTEHDADYCRKRVLAHLADGTLYTWRNAEDKITALTSNGITYGYGKISSVYTLPQYRRKGYAINLVAKVTERILEEKLIPILYTNADYKASNECYKKIGYEEVGSLCTVCKGNRSC